MNNFSKDSLVQELYHNFIESLTIVSSRLVLDLFDKKGFPDEFEKEEFLNQLVKTWKNSTQEILQKKINEFYEFQSTTLKKSSLLNVLYGEINIEDVQKICNDAYKTACDRVDSIIKAMKDE